MVCIGKGSPTVVFEQGWGASILDWRRIQEAVSAKTKACFYDRAGAWHSDPAVRPSTAWNVTDDLHALLRKANIRRPVVLVAHSLGGLFATLYTDRFPRDVSGLVLLDPVFADQLAPPAAEDANKVRVAEVIQYLRGCASLARQGELKPSEPHHCFDKAPTGYTADELAFMLPRALMPYRYETNASEMLAGDESREQERRAARAFGDLPMIVLTAGARPAGEPAERAWDAHLKKGQAALAARSTRGRQIVVANSGHDIANDEPQAVIDAIIELIEQSRHQAHPRGG
jgi:pimeloyl-ACP methyl ester carboxylesterase